MFFRICQFIIVSCFIGSHLLFGATAIAQQIPLFSAGSPELPAALSDGEPLFYGVVDVVSDEGLVVDDLEYPLSKNCKVLDKNGAKTSSLSLRPGNLIGFGKNGAGAISVIYIFGEKEARP